MEILLNGLFANYYGLIKERLLHLTPLEKKVGLFAIAYLSCAMVGYFVYSLYGIRAYQMARQKERVGEEYDDILYTPSPQVWGKWRDDCRFSVKSNFASPFDSPNILD